MLDCRTHQAGSIEEDCLHSCLPGPVDTWNQLLINLIQQRHARLDGTRAAARAAGGGGSGVHETRISSTTGRRFFQVEACSLNLQPSRSQAPHPPFETSRFSPPPPVLDVSLRSTRRCRPGKRSGTPSGALLLTSSHASRAACDASAATWRRAGGGPSETVAASGASCGSAAAGLARRCR